MTSSGLDKGLKETVKNRILKYIETLPVENNVKLPSERELCLRLNVSRITLRSVLDDLLAEGRIFRKHGSGTYVNPVYHSIKASVYPAQLLQDAIRCSGYTPSSRYLGAKIVPATESIAAALHISPTADVFASQVLMYADDHPCIWCTDYYSPSLVESDKVLADWVKESSVFEIISERTGRSIAWDFLRLDVTDNLRTPVLNRYLECSRGMPKPFLVTRTANFDENNKPFIYSVCYIDTGYIEYGLIRKKQVATERVRATKHAKPYKSILSE